jgi:translation elongation factor EF-G
MRIRIPYVTLTCAFVADAVHGAEVQTESMWAAAEACGLPCLVALSRLDRERGDYTRALARYNGSLGRAEYPNAVLAIGTAPLTMLERD